MELRTTAGFTETGFSAQYFPKETADGLVSKIPAPTRNTHTKSGHCRIADTGEERTDRGDESEEDTENTKRKRR